MAESPKSGGEKPTSLIKAGIAAGLIGAVLAAWAVTAMVHDRNEAFAWDIVGLFGAVLTLGLSGYLFWGYRYLSRRPELRPGTPEGIRRLSQQPHAAAWAKWRRMRHRAMRITGPLLSAMSLGYGIFLIATGRPGGAFPIILALIIIVIWRFITRHTDNGRLLNSGKEGDGSG